MHQVKEHFQLFHLRPGHLTKIPICNFSIFYLLKRNPSVSAFLFTQPSIAHHYDNIHKTGASSSTKLHYVLYHSSRHYIIMPCNILGYTLVRAIIAYNTHSMMFVNPLNNTRPSSTTTMKTTHNKILSPDSFPLSSFFFHVF